MKTKEQIEDKVLDIENKIDNIFDDLFNSDNKIEFNVHKGRFLSIYAKKMILKWVLED